MGCLLWLVKKKNQINILIHILSQNTFKVAPAKKRSLKVDMEEVEAKYLSEAKCQLGMWWHMLVIPAMREAEMGGLLGTRHEAWTGI
jgi:hypothetical protein